MLMARSLSPTIPKPSSTPAKLSRVLRLGPVVVLASAILCGCQEETTGRCCTALAPEAQGSIPQPDIPEGKAPRDVFAENTRFDCDEEFCVSARGSEAFCTRRCDDDCPDGFECKSVLESADCDYNQRTPETDDDCKIGAVTPEDKFCVRKACQTDDDCPGDSACGLVHAGGGTEDNPEVKQCVKKEHTCAEVNQ